MRANRAWSCVFLFLFGCASGERPPDLAHPLAHAGPGFKMRYPGNWKLRVAGSDPGSFRVESPQGDCFLDVDVDNPAGNYRKKLEGRVARRVLAMPQPSYKPVKQWGSNTGQGMLLVGKMSSMATVTGYTLVFVFVGGESAAHLTESCLDELRASTRPGFDFIANSFQVF